MRIRRLAVTGAALVALAGLSACTAKDTPATTGAGASAGAPAVESTAGAPSDASKELAAAATKLTSSSGKIHMTMTGGMTGEGAFDTPNRVVDMTMALAGFGDISVRQIGTDLYVKVGGAAAKSFGTKWMHLDASKMPATSALSLEKNDPRNSAKMLESSTDVKKTGDGKFAGTIDITKSPTATAEMLKGLAGKTTQVPFTAEVDGDGNLSRMSLDMDSVAQGAGKVDAIYSDIGSKVTVAAPAKAQTIEMSDSALKSIGG
ncbi:hypothetical protein [Actinoplanes sp. L3-i22]|uniref:hypothetical protein n=1 Tax=Actinoplanes sp. L3-i22 TaxID=2836373 RepID=UPI001C846F74|nr:hypothetical protein [Actinoplanes sp. L3-i22]